MQRINTTNPVSYTLEDKNAEQVEGKLSTQLICRKSGNYHQV